MAISSYITTFEDDKFRKYLKAGNLDAVIELVEENPGYLNKSERPVSIGKMRTELVVEVVLKRLLRANDRYIAYTNKTTLARRDALIALLEWLMSQKTVIDQIGDFFFPKTDYLSLRELFKDAGVLDLLEVAIWNYSKSCHRSRRLKHWGL